jgi:hypothetical protein
VWRHGARTIADLLDAGASRAEEAAYTGPTQFGNALPVVIEIVFGGVGETTVELSLGLRQIEVMQG